jgi:Sulfatase
MSSIEKSEQGSGRAAKLNKLIPLLSAALLIVSNLFVFGPATIYQANTEEMTIPLTSILKTLALPALAGLSILVLVGLLLRGKAHQIYASVLFACGLLVWLQGNFLVWNYGLLNGQGIDWAKNAWRGWADGTLWVGLLVLAVLFYRKVYRIATWGSAAVVAVLLVSLLITSLQNPETWAAKEKARRPLVPPEEIFEFSSRSNVIHLVLDGFQSDIFSELVAGNFDYYSRSLQGFTFFQEALGCFPTTYMSVPAFLSGRVYKNDLPMRRFVNEVNQGKTIFNELYDRGYETHLVETWRFTKGTRNSRHYQIPVPYGGTQRKNVRSNSALMLDMVLFRHAPHFLKRYVYNHQTWLIQRLFTPKDRLLNLEYFSDTAFMNDLIEHMTAKKDKPVYKYIHLMTSHFPMLVDENCQYAGEIPSSRENIKIQATCVLHQIVRFLDQLKSAGIYDSSLIIIQSDHGQGHDIAWTNPHGAGEKIAPIGSAGLSVIAGSALALVLIKPPQDTDAFRVSPAQVSLTDLPATVNSLLGIDEDFGGRSMFEVSPDEVRERRFLYHEWGQDDWKKSFFPRLDEFVVRGSAYDIDSWRLDKTYLPPRRRP